MTGPRPDSPYLLVVTLAPYDASCTLFFTHLAARLPLRIVQYPNDDIAGPLSGASAVIFVRGLFEFGNLIACAERLGVPRYYFLDDNFMLIRQEADTYGSQYENYSNERVRAALRNFSGVLLPTASLTKYFADERLHPDLMPYPPVAGPVLESPRRDGDHRLTLAFFGGIHRREPFARSVYPAVCRLACERPVKLVAAGFEAGSLAPAPGLEIVFPRYEPSYTAALGLMARHGIDILVHPSGATANNIYKNPHVLINARALGAAPIFSNVPPYDAIAGEGVALLCDNSEEEWYAALASLAGDSALRRTLLSRLDVYCDEHFDGRLNSDVLGGMLGAHPAPAAFTRLSRQVAASACLAFGHARRRIVGKILRAINQ